MDNNKAFMTVGELAKKMNTTVRTLQYYDTEGLLKPSKESVGGRRLYSEKDMIKLYQIMSLKSIGLSLEDIKKSMISLDTPEEVAKMLLNQEKLLENKIEFLNNSLNEMKILRDEVLQMKKVDFKRYSDIITNLQMKNDFYWLIKHFDDNTMDYLRENYNNESGLIVINKCTKLYNEAIEYQKQGIKPDSEIGYTFAKTFWDFVMEFTKGDINLLTKLMNLSEDENNPMTEKQKEANNFIGNALENYFKINNENPLERNN